MAAPIDHGQWVSYVPDTIPDGVPTNSMFAQRQSDSKDWYSYLYTDTNPFNATSVKLTVGLDQATSLMIIRAPAVDPSQLFPNGVQVVELLGDYSNKTSSELISMFAGKVIDLTTGDVTDPPPPVARTGA